MRLLLIEDEADLRRSLQRLFREEGYATDAADNGPEGLHKATEWDYDAIVLDHLLPGMDGREVLRRLRRIKSTPVLMLTALDSTDDRITGLDLGADDYLAKPFESRELLARLRAIIRRHHRGAVAVIEVGAFTVNTATRRAYRGGDEIALTGREYAVLEYLAMRRDTVVSRQQLYDHLFDENDDTLSNLIEVHICNLRRKLDPALIRTRRGLGYVIESRPGADA